MATVTAVRVAHATLAANTLDTVTLTGGAQASAEILNRSTSDIYFTVDGSAPTVGGNDSYVVQAGQWVKVSVALATNTVVKLIAAAVAAYSVTGA